MLTEELTKKLDELEYSWDTHDYKNNTYIEIYDPCNEEYPDEEIAIVCVNKPYIFDTNTYLFEQMDEEYQKELFELLEAYSRTPADEREEEKYTYKHKSLKTKGGKFSYLAIRKILNMSYAFLQGSDVDIFEYKIEFTDKEIEEVKKEFDINLDDYIKEETRRRIYED